MAKANQRANRKPEIKVRSSRITEAKRQKKLRQRREQKALNRAKFGV